MKHALLILGLLVAILLVGAKAALDNDQDGFIGRRLRLLFCTFGYHKRLARSVRKAPDGYTAHCRGCGIRLRRANHGDPWEPVEDEAGPGASDGDKP